ncbi:MAG: hypothetical protein GX769_04715 [Erysipelothrix sp.]|nr:hypothetical protein [Erysipelothrix sp.]
MHALIIVLNKTELMEEILNSLMAIGVKGATILDSQGMGSKILSKNYSSSNLFGAFKTAFDREHPYNKTIFTVIEGEELLHKAMETIQAIAGDLSNPGEGLMFTVPVGHVMGLAPSSND